MRIIKYLLFFVIIASQNLSILNAQTPKDTARNFKIVKNFQWKINAIVSIPTSTKGAIVLISKNPIMDTLVDQKFYQRGENINNAKVARDLDIGNNDLFLQSLDANTTYYLAFFPYNKVDSNSTIFYSKKPYKVSFTTEKDTFDNYYSGLDVSQPDFLTQLSAKLQYTLPANHYFNYGQIVEEQMAYDTILNNTPVRFVNCDYSDLKGFFNGNFSFGNSVIDFNREHTLAKNWMNHRQVTNNSLLHNFNEGADWHNLAMTQGTQVNSKRSDYALDIVDNDIQEIGLSKFGKNKLNQTVFEPKNAYKGNAARSIFYQIIAYNGTFGANWGIENFTSANGLNQNQVILKDWARNDIPDAYEKARHALIYSVQKNRNPFIDFPEWIDCIDFNKVLKTGNCKTIPNSSINHIKKWDVNAYFANETLKLSLYHDKVRSIQIQLFDMNGKLVFNAEPNFGKGFQQIELEIPYLNSGIYFIKVQNGDLLFTSKLLKN
jgi:endonuclease I